MNDDVVTSAAPWEPMRHGLHPDTSAPVDVIVNLDGPEAQAYEEFRAAAKALTDSALVHQAAQGRYRAALERLSALAAKVP